MPAMQEMGVSVPYAQQSMSSTQPFLAVTMQFAQTPCEAAGSRRHRGVPLSPMQHSDSVVQGPVAGGKHLRGHQGGAGHVYTRGGSEQESQYQASTAHACGSP